VGDYYAAFRLVSSDEGYSRYASSQTALPNIEARETTMFSRVSTQTMFVYKANPRLEKHSAWRLLYADQLPTSQDDVKERLDWDKPCRYISAVGENILYGEEPLSAAI